MIAFIKKILIVFSGNISTSVGSFLLASIVIKKYDTTTYGNFIIFQTFFLIGLNALRPITWQAYIRFSESNKNQYTIPSLIIDLIFSIIVAFIIYALIGYFCEIGYSIHLVFILILSLFFIQNGTIIGILRKKNEFGFISCCYIFSMLAKLVGIFMLSHSNAEAIFMYTLYVDLACWSVLTLYVLKKNNSNLLETIIITKLEIIDYFKFSCWGTVHAIIDLPVTQLDKFIVATFLGPNSVAIYNIIKRLGSIMEQISEPINQILYPRFTEIIKNNDINDVFVIAKKIILLVFCLSIFILIFYYLSINWFDVKFFNEQLFNYRWIIFIFLVGQSIVLMLSWLNPFSVALGLMKENMITLIITNTIHCIVIFSLTKYIGFVGAVFSVFIQYAIFYFFKILFIKRKLS
ncbi:lipopolysaccharide biosynthesis protein [Citrobacter portucalensis]|uniref:lipopolysaccharide biosynthesis protein n=1 Tax=Citrobacter portucalensis TaxID=1639133 RepID=UPI00301C70F1